MKVVRVDHQGYQATQVQPVKQGRSEAPDKRENKETKVRPE